MTPWGAQVELATAEVTAALAQLASWDWSVPAGSLIWSCHQTAAHLANDVTKYAAQLAGRATGSYVRFTLTVPSEHPPTELVRTIDACGRLLATTIDATPADARAWHWGPTDRSGFAAMGIGELLVHAFDITSGLGAAWHPPRALAQSVLERLLADAAPDTSTDPASLLLWATGRLELPGRSPAGEWVWRAAVA